MDLKLDKIKEILMKPQDSRNSEDIKLLALTVAHVKFFEELKEHKNVYRECCMYLAYEKFNKNQFVFKEGELGDKFFILIKGEAKVMINVKVNEQISQKEVLSYKDGESFGELALTSNKPRAASILTKCECHFAVLDKFNYNRILSSLLNTKRTELIEYLKQHDYFKHLTKVSLLKLSYCFEEKILTKDQILFKEGDSLDFIYFIKEGEVKLSRKIKIQMINSFEPVTKGTLFLKKHCWKSADVGVLESGGLIGINDLENEKHSVSCKVCSKTAKILQVTLQNFRKRMNNDETLSVINHGKTMRNLLIQDNTKSATKILKDRIFSPYKQLFAEETLNKPSKIDLVGKTPKNNEKVSRPSRRKSSSYEDINEKVPKFATFDVNSKVKQEIYKNSRRIRTTAPVGSKDSSRLNSEADDARKAVRSRISQRKTKSMDHEDHSSTSIKKRKCNISYLIMKMNPFGKTKSVNPTPKIEEVVNMHVQSKKNLSIRPNTPKNWSFMNFNSPIRRPISTLCRIKDT